MCYVFRPLDPSGKERKRTMADGGERGEKRDSNSKTATASPWAQARLEDEVTERWRCWRPCAIYTVKLQL